MNDMTPIQTTLKDWESDQEVRWCPGCGDYAILKAVQRTLPQIGADPARTVFVSGIGCSSRFPYYIESYGFHTIHGRAPAPSAKAQGLAGRSTEPCGVEGVVVPMRLVGEYWPLVSP